MQQIILVLIYFITSSALGTVLCRGHYKKINTKIVSDEFAKEFPRIAKSQPSEVTVQGKKVLVYNNQIADSLKKIKKVASKSELSQIIQLLLKNKVLEFPLTQEGFLPAANNGDHEGGYGQFMWYRDLARASQGLTAFTKMLSEGAVKKNYSKKDKLMTKSLVELLSEKEQIARTLSVIKNPEIVDDPATGYKNVPYVRLSIEGRREGQKLTPEIIQMESAWGHKQNDALSLYSNNILDKIASGDLKIEKMSVEAQAQLFLLASYFQRVNYFKMKDVGAWEEKMGIRTSSVALTLSFLERFDYGWKQKEQRKSKTAIESENEKVFFKKLKNNWETGAYDQILSNFTGDSHRSRDGLIALKNIINRSFDYLPAAINNGYELLADRLGSAKVMEVVDKSVHSNNRGSDAAILHMLLYPPKELSLSDRLQIVKKITGAGELLRISGFSRYLEDWFLLGGPYAMKFAGTLIPENPDAIAVADGKSFRSSTRLDRDHLVEEFDRQKFEKNMTQIVEKSGPGLEAQWSFQDSMLVQIYVQFYKETKNEEYKKAAWFHLSRSLGWITGEQQINIEGHAVLPWKTPEALIPVRIMHQGKPQVVYFASPNSPLNWTTAELAKALADYNSILEDK